MRSIVLHNVPINLIGRNDVGFIKGLPGIGIGITIS